MQVKEPSGHIDQMLRQTRIHHVQLSGMADIKANILLSVSAVMLTFCLPYLTQPIVQWPALVVITFCGFTALASILSLIPKMPKGIRRDKSHPMFNLLFFGSFADLDYDEFKGEMEIVCNRSQQNLRSPGARGVSAGSLSGPPEILLSARGISGVSIGDSSSAAWC